MYFCYGNLDVSCNGHVWMVWIWGTGVHWHTDSLDTAPLTWVSRDVGREWIVSCQSTVPMLFRGHSCSGVASLDLPFKFTVANEGMWDFCCVSVGTRLKSNIWSGRRGGYFLGAKSLVGEMPFFFRYALPQLCSSFLLLELMPSCPVRQACCP